MHIPIRQTIGAILHRHLSLRTIQAFHQPPRIPILQPQWWQYSAYFLAKRTTPPAQFPSRGFAQVPPDELRGAIASELGLTPAQLNTVYHRLKQNLRDLLGGTEIES